MPRSFDANSGQRINTPKVAQGPPGVPNQGGGVGLRQPRTINPIQPRTRKDELQRPIPQHTAAPSHTGAIGPPAQAQPVQPAAVPGGRPTEGPLAGAVKTGEQYQGPMGERISVKRTPEQQMADSVGGGAQPMDNVSGQAVSPPMQPSPLGADSPIENMANTGGFRLGQNAHIRKIAMPKMQGLSREQQIEYEQKAVRDFQQFGAYEGMDDPNTPPPPINVGGYSYNPETGHWVEPEGYVSVLARYSS